MSDEPGCARACLAKVLPQYRTSESIIEEYGNWEPPNEADAREEYLKTHEHHNVYDMRAPVKDLKEFGEGVQMYFYMLKFTSILFGILAFVPGLLLVVFNTLGGWYDTADLERTMLGNYGLLDFNGNSADFNITTTTAFTVRSASLEGNVTALFTATANETPVNMAGMNKRSLLVAMSALDLVGVLLFFGYSLFMIWFVRTRTSAGDSANTTIKDYSVRVERLPADTSAAALKEYLTVAAGEGAEIVQVELCRSVNTLLALVVERGEMIKESELTLAVVQRQAEKFPRVSVGLEVDVLFSRYFLEDITAAIKQEQAATKSNQVVTAFVTFATADARYRAMEALPRSLMLQVRMKPESKFNNGGVGGAQLKPVALDVSPAPEPADVLYENLEFTRLQRFVRRIFTNTAKYLVLLIGFLLVSLAPAMRIGVSVAGAGPTTSQCDASCTYTDAAGNYVISDTNREIYRGCDPEVGTGALANKLDCESQSVCYECFCRAALNDGSYIELLYCSRFSNVVAISTLAQALAVVGIVLANMIIEFVITWLVRQEKHHTRTREAVGTVRGLFIFTLINTAFTNLIANMYLPGPARIVSGSFLKGYIFSGSYADTTPNWYRDVGRPILLSIFFTTVIVHLKVGIRWWWRRRRLATRYQSLTQWQLAARYEGHVFELSVKYGQHLYIIYLTMMYSSGMPLLYMLAAVHFITCYWTEKYELLRLCARPLTYSRDLAVYVMSSLPFAALWHLAFAIWFFSLFGVPKSPVISYAFRKSLQSSVAAFKGLMPVASNLTPQLVAWRFTQNSTGHLFIAFMACGGVIFIFFTLSWWMQSMRSLASLLGCIKDSGSAGEAAVSGIPEFAVALRSQMLVGPASYAVQQNPAYAHAFLRMEELQWERQRELDAKAAAKAMEAEGFSGGGGDATSLMLSKRKRTKANRLRAKQHAAASAAGGWAGAVAGNQVAPEPLLAAPMPKAPPLRAATLPQESSPRPAQDLNSFSKAKQVEGPVPSVGKMDQVQLVGPMDGVESVGPMEREERRVSSVGGGRRASVGGGERASVGGGERAIQQPAAPWQPRRWADLDMGGASS